MTGQKTKSGASLAALLVAGLAACAPQERSRPAPTSGQGASVPHGAPGHTMSGVSGAGMDQQSMAAHCAEMRQTVRQGGRLSPDMQRMMAHCGQMDHQLGTHRGR